MPVYYTASDRYYNQPKILKTTIDSIVVGKHQVCLSIVKSISQHFGQKKSPCLMALDGYLGIDWENTIEELQDILTAEGIGYKFFDISKCLKKPSEIDLMIDPYLDRDPYFGYVFEGHISQFFDNNKIDRIRKDLHDIRNSDKPANIAIICYGVGAAIPPLREYFDYIFYFDLTREELFNRSENNPIACLGSKESKNAVHRNFKRFCYIDSVVLDKHKENTLKEMSWYVEGNNPDEIKLIPKNSYEQILSKTSQSPIIIKQLYYPVVWGGDWQKKIKKLPSSMPNSGQGSIVPNENSVEILLDRFIIDIPFQNLLWLKSKSIIGNSAYQITNGKFPLSYFYDDEIVGGHMAIQVHPDDDYIRQNFNEPTRQDESYYILQTGLGAKTYLGLKENADLGEFQKETILSEKEKKPFDYEKYVDSVNTVPGDFLLIPAGTIHASGKNQVVVEIDWVNTTYTPGYTFHIYDYLRPDLDGTYRAMHINHAFDVIKGDRRTEWVRQNLKQKPQLLRKGHGWAEYSIGQRDDMRFEVHRLEFQKRINDKTEPEQTFQALTLVEGQSVIIRSMDNPEIQCRLEFPDTLIIPACLGKYTIYNLNKKTCKIVKAMVRT